VVQEAFQMTRLEAMHDQALAAAVVAAVTTTLSVR
jgi:hypothetical protein